jgi:hypothetical protein
VVRGGNTSKIVLTPNTEWSALDVVKVYDPQGNVVGYYPSRNPEFIGNERRLPPSAFRGSRPRECFSILEQAWEAKGVLTTS